MTTQLSTVEARERLNAERRWFFAKTFIEPVIAEASNDETALGLLPNHEFQIRNPAPALAGVKCRKIAWSWCIAAKALCRAATEPRSTNIIGSYDEDEAKEKLNFLDWIYKAVIDSTPALLRELGMTDGMEVRRFENGSRIRFISRKAPTGAGASIDWDEFSIEEKGRVSAATILAAALGCTTHTGTISIGGTQRGPDTVFNQIVSGTIDEKMRNNPMFANFPKRTWVVGRFPWWSSPALCKDVIRAVALAPNMATEDRVDRFGNDKLRQQFINYCTTPEQGIEMFQREFEMMILDDKDSYFEDDLIELCYDLAGENYTFLQCEIEGAKYGQFGDALAPAKLLIDRLATEIRAGNLKGDWGWTFDVGDTRDPDEIWIGQVPRDDREMLCPRLNIGMHKMPFDGKEELAHYLLKRLPVTRGSVDGTNGSLGVMLAQRLHLRYGQRAAPFQFTLVNKTLLASGTKARMQSAKLKLPPKSKKFQKLHNQFKRIKREESKTGMIRYDGVRNKDDHCDCFWSLSLLCELFSHAIKWTPRRTVVVASRS